ncbi:regulator of G-protein signaling 2 [Xyrichtys novacula]|uniref:Regulator of G-protein signaling 2 n=1 Tax=Xyrichtys novacula TaxID=13765 RepID=A0AAV1FJE4_XYRNO|nr:regulator of G-protein signaling 2 [Xyrichtys novacula]
MEARGGGGGSVYAVTAYHCLRPLRVIPGQVTVYTARANHVTDLSAQAPPPRASYAAGCGRSEAIKPPDKPRGRQRGERNMREDPAALITSQNMAFTDCMKPTDLSAEKKGIKRRNWRNRIAILLKTNSSHSILHLMKNRSYRPTADDVSQWAQSLDTLLSHKYGKAAFCIFLKSEFCEENIEFWMECEDYKAQTSHKELASRAKSIYEQFIKNEAPKEINLDYHTKNAIAQSLHEPTTTSFLAAQRKVYSLMENNSYPRFIHSDLYRELCDAAGGEAKLIKS